MSAPPARLYLSLLLLTCLAGAAVAAAPPPRNVVVTPLGGQIHGGSLALDPRNRAHVAVVYWDERRDLRGTCTIAVSADGGATWKNLPFAGAGSANPLPSGMALCRNPVVAFGREGALYAAYEVASLSGFSQVLLARSTDGGVTFGGTRVLEPDAASGGDRDPRIAVGKKAGQVYVSFQRYAADDDEAAVHVVSSTDGGTTLTATRVSPPEQNAAGSRASIAVDPAGTVYVAWVDGSGVDLAAGGGTANIEVVSSAAGGGRFGAAQAVAEVPGGCGPDGDCGNRYPAVTIAAPAKGRLVAAWSAAPFPEPARISVARSGNGGRDWTTPKELATPAGSGDRDEYAAELTVAPDLRIDLVHLRRARDADIGLLDVEVSHSLDGGRTFSRPFGLDDVPSATQWGDFGAAVSVQASNAVAATAWIDGRRGAAGAPVTDVVFAARRDSAAPRAPSVRGDLVVRDGRPGLYRLASTDAFTPTAALRFRCGFDGASLRTCPAQVVRRLAPGQHVLRVQAVDAAGNRSVVTRVRIVVRALTSRRR